MNTGFPAAAALSAACGGVPGARVLLRNHQGSLGERG